MSTHNPKVTLENAIIRRGKRRGQERVRKIHSKAPRGYTTLTAKMEKAAYLLAEGLLSQQKIAEHPEIDVRARTIRDWLNVGAFKKRIEVYRKEIAHHFAKEGLADRTIRIRNLTRYHAKLEKIIADRAEDPELADAPGADTGLVIKRLKGIGSGDIAKIVEEYETDFEMIDRLQALQEDVAIEAGQRKRDGTDDSTVPRPVFNQINVAFVTPEQVNGKPGKSLTAKSSPQFIEA